MNYTENFPKTKRSCWFEVSIAPLTHEQVTAAHAWCKEQESNGYFTYDWPGNYWWFQHEEDAMWFTLTWSTVGDTNIIDFYNPYDPQSLNEDFYFPQRGSKVKTLPK